MCKDLSKIKTVDLLNETSRLLSQATTRLELGIEDRKLISDYNGEIERMINSLEEAEGELEESLIEQDRQDGLRLRSQNQIPQEGGSK